MRTITSIPDLDAEHRRVDRSASATAQAADRHILRLAGAILFHSAEVNGADYEVSRLNARLRASGCSDLVMTATARLRAPIDGRLVAAAAAALTGAHRG